MTTTGIARDAGTVTGWNLVSRITGFVRVLVIGGALGATRLGDTYQASNQVSNLLFEFLAAGTLSAVLIPGLTARLGSGDRRNAEEFAGAFLARALLVVGAIAIIGALAARPIMLVLLGGNEGGTEDSQLRLATFLLLFVMPQLVFYAWGAVVTAMLNANGHFAAGAAAPVANNVCVIVAAAVFWWRGASGIELGWIDRTLLGAGALGGVICMTLVPAVAAWRHGLRVRPVWTPQERVVLPVRDVAWATMVVLPAQVFLFVAIVVSGRVPGGVIASQIALTLFLLPHALLGHPLATVLYPRAAKAWSDDDREAFRRTAAAGLRALVLLTAPVAGLLVALAPWLVEVVSIGALARGAGPAVVAAPLMGFAVGLTAYSWSLFATRLSYAAADVRTPGVAALAGAVAGIAVLGVAAQSDGTALLYRVGIAHTSMVAVAAVLTLLVLARRDVIAAAWSSWVAFAVVAALVGLGARVVADRFGPPTSRLDALAVIAVCVALGVAVYAGGLAACGVRIRALRAELS